MTLALRNRIFAGFFAALFAACGLLAMLSTRESRGQAASAPQIVVTELRLPTHGSGKKGLEALMVRPNDSAPHPLALMTHGSPRDPKERDEMTPLRFLPQAREFARRGWTAVVVMRRGYGDSGGGYAEEGHACSAFVNYVGATKEADKDLREAAEYLRTRPEMDPSRMIAIGVSTGGLAMVGLSADPPPGLAAAISFAGGRGSNAPDHVCNSNVLVDAFAEFGKHSKVPMLWIYAQNDHFFSPQLAQGILWRVYASWRKREVHRGGTFRRRRPRTFFAARHSDLDADGGRFPEEPESRAARFPARDRGADDRAAVLFFERSARRIPPVFARRAAQGIRGVAGARLWDELRAAQHRPGCEARARIVQAFCAEGLAVLDRHARRCETLRFLRSYTFAGMCI
jgi:dienelactone hydrolase